MIDVLSTNDAAQLTPPLKVEARPDAGVPQGTVPQSTGTEDPVTIFSKTKIQEALRDKEVIAQRADELRKTRKSNARQQVQNIRKQIEALQLIRVIDPKAASGELSRLARGLSDAIESYAGSRGKAAKDEEEGAPEQDAETRLQTAVDESIEMGNETKDSLQFKVEIQGVANQLKFALSQDEEQDPTCRKNVLKAVQAAKHYKI